ncbi:Pentatricopeptide repeat [Macleaya cordata]|uniref:Pentatricopeptide repeat n=1 Tax=Macleaya cordata TaxID=56857 RepID=A0A200PR96_MACCD|nr:Pentatricopeptide repeat [Macleaya cordata]
MASMKKWVFFGSTRTKVNRVVVNCFENGLVKEEEDEDISTPINEEETLGVSDEKKMPPWGNLDIEVDGSLESSGDCTPSNSGRISCILEPRLHFLEERDEEILSKRVLSLSRLNKVRSAFDLYMSMEVSGLQPNLHACNSLISSLLRNGFLNEALKVFEMMKKKEMTTGHTYSLILKAVASIQGCDSALEMFMDLEGESRQRKDFDVIVYNTMISICGKANNWIQTEKMWRTLKENGHQGTTVTYGLLISIFIRCGQSELALDAYSEMIENRLEPTEDMMQAIISASTKEGNWSLALSVFKSMLNSGLSPNSIAYNSLINSLGKAGEIKLAFWVFDLMQSSGHKPDEYTWNALLSSLYRGNRYSDAIRLFESIKREQKSQLNSHLYNTALMSCQRLGLWDRSLQLLWQMEASGLAVSTASYNLVIDACEVARKPKIALQVYEHMVHKNCTPNTFTYLSLIRSCIWGSLWPEVEEILDSVTPDVSLYNAAIHGMCLRGKISSAKKLYMKMRDRGLKPDGKTRALMLQNLKRDSIRQRNRYPSRRRGY